MRGGSDCVRPNKQWVRDQCGMPDDTLDSPAELSMSKLMIALAGQALVFSAVGALLWYLSGRNLSGFVSFNQTEIISGVLLGGGMSAVGALVFIGWQSVGDKLVLLQEQSLEFLSSKLSMPTIIWISACAGIGEEVLFRGGLQTIIADYIGGSGAVIVASALFAIAHFSKPLIAALLLLIGVCFGVVFLYTGSLITVVIGHALYDVFALWYVQKRLTELSGNMEGPRSENSGIT